MRKINNVTNYVSTYNQNFQYDRKANYTDRNLSSNSHQHPWRKQNQTQLKATTTCKICRTKKSTSGSCFCG